MSDIDIDPILKLSCLSITDEKKAAFNTQLHDILTYMDVLNNVTHDAHSDFEWPIHKDALTRTDKPQPFDHELVEKNAPKFSDHSFVVPKIGS